MKKLFLLIGLVTLLAAPAMAGRSIDGSYVELIGPPGPYCPSTVYDFEFYVFNNSMDTEWIQHIEIFFPDCWEIVVGSDWYEPDPGAGGSFNFIFMGGGNAAIWGDADGGWGEIYGGEGGTFGISVHVCPDQMGDVPIQWGLFGDIYGGEPHEVFGEIWVEVTDLTPTEDSSWSQLKGLY